MRTTETTEFSTRVAVFSKPDDLHELADVLAEELGLHPTDAMHEAAQYLVGKHDFTTFRAAQCQANSPVKTLDRIEVARYGELIEIRTDARSFLHNQVRSMAGSLRLVGEGKWRPLDLKRVLDAAERSACGPVAPPEGLYLLRVGYTTPEK